MRVSNIEIGRTEDAVELSAQIDDFRLWYRFPPEYAICRRGDPFVAAALLPSMVHGEPLEVEPGAPVSPRLLQGVEKLQDVYCCWYPYLKRTEIHADVSEGEPANAGVGCFFSGGVDSAYTLLKNSAEITHLIFVKGIDMQLDNDGLFEEACACNSRIARHYGKTLLTVASNVRFFGHAHKPLDWTMHNGGGLASVALALAFPKVFIPSSHTYAELFPWGSHPLTDHLWSSDSTRFVHDGAEAQRSEKLLRISRCEVVMSGLRVCWQDAGYNCGRCEKCLRTMVALRALGLSSASLPPLGDLAPVRRLQIYGESEFSFTADNLALAERSQDRELSSALRACLRRYERRKTAAGVDRLLFGGLLKRSFRRLVRAA